MKKALFALCGGLFVISGCSVVGPAPSGEIDSYAEVTIWHNGKVEQRIIANSMSPQSRLKSKNLDKMSSTPSTQSMAAERIFEKIGHAFWKFDVKNGTLESLYGSTANVHFSLQPCNRVAEVQENEIGSPVLKCVEPNGIPMEYSGVLNVSSGHQVDFEFGSGYRARLAVVGKDSLE